MVGRNIFLEHSVFEKMQRRSVPGTSAVRTNDLIIDECQREPKRVAKIPEMNR